MRKTQKGFTFIELILGLTMSVSIFIVAASIVASLLGSTTKSKQTQALEQVKNDLATDMSNSVRWADNIDFIAGNFEVDGNTYHLQDGRIYKNDEPLTPADVVVESFDVQKYTTITKADNPGTGTGLLGDYYNGKHFDDLKLSQIDLDVDFDWQREAPSSVMNSDLFSIRWTGQVEIPETGKYAFYTISDDGVRLWVNNEQLIDHFNDHPKSYDSGSIDLEGGNRYDIRLEYFEAFWNAVIKLGWITPSSPPGGEIIPTARLYPTSSSASLEITAQLQHKVNTAVSDTFRLVLSPRGGTVGAVEPAPVDQCANIEFIQNEVPDGLIKQGDNCVEPPPPEDQCENLDGFQSSVPPGYTQTGKYCEEIIPVDLCANIAGVQTSVPFGMIRDGENCVTPPPPPSPASPPPPTDVCPNLDGIQETVPSGYIKQGGNCVKEPDPLR